MTPLNSVGQLSLVMPPGRHCNAARRMPAGLLNIHSAIVTRRGERHLRSRRSRGLTTPCAGVNNAAYRGG